MVTKICIICNQPYEAYAEHRKGRRSGAKIRSNSITCSHQCSRAYTRVYKHMKSLFIKREIEKEVSEYDKKWNKVPVIVKFKRKDGTSVSLPAYRIEKRKKKKKSKFGGGY